MDNQIYTASTGYEMKEARIFLGKQKNFAITIASMHHSGSTGYVLLESVAFEDCENTPYADPPFTNDCNGEFRCSKSYGNCVPRSVLCDFENDCRLAEDEKDCKNYVGRCDFENNMDCNFWNLEDSDERWGWQIENGMSGYPFLPKMDHTAYTDANYFFTFHSSIMKNYIHDGEKYFTSRYKSDIIASRVTSTCR